MQRLSAARVPGGQPPRAHHGITTRNSTLHVVDPITGRVDVIVQVGDADQLNRLTPHPMIAGLPSGASSGTEQVVRRAVAPGSAGRHPGCPDGLSTPPDRPTCGVVARFEDVVSAAGYRRIGDVSGGRPSTLADVSSEHRSPHVIFTGSTTAHSEPPKVMRSARTGSCTKGRVRRAISGFCGAPSASDRAPVQLN